MYMEAYTTCIFNKTLLVCICLQKSLDLTFWNGDLTRWPTYMTIYNQKYSINKKYKKYNQKLHCDTCPEIKALPSISSVIFSNISML